MKNIQIGLIDIPEHLKEFCLLSPFPVYLVGGAVRNSLLGLKGGDLDICGAASEKDVCGEIAQYVPINKRLGTAEITFKGVKFEYTRFRKEAYDGSGAHLPTKVSFGADLFDDAKRRDFTANAIYYDIKNDKIIDPLNGLDDIKTKTLRAFNPEYTFSSDGLRLMRLCRQAAQLGFKISTPTYDAAKAKAFKLADIAAERKRDELELILTADKKYGIVGAHSRGLRFLYDLGLFKFILPSIEALNIPQNPKYHSYSVLEHTFKAVEFAEPDIRLAALMHDTGKPVCESLYGNMYNHAAESEKITLRELGQNGLKYPKGVVKETARLVSLHMYDKDGATSDSKMRLFAAENFALLEKLQSLAACDRFATGQGNPRKPRFLYFKEILLKECAPLKVQDLKIDGNDVSARGFKGEEIKKLLYRLWRECVLNPKLNSKEWLLNRIDEIKK